MKRETSGIRFIISIVFMIVVLLSILLAIHENKLEKEVYVNQLPDYVFSLSRVSRNIIRDCIVLEGYSFYGDWTERTDAPQEVIDKCLAKLK